VDQKRTGYEGLGITEYWRFDQTGDFHGTRLAGDRLVDGRYVPIEVTGGDGDVIRGYSAALDLELHWYDGSLRFWDPNAGEYLPELTEAKAQRDAALEQVRQLEAELARLQSGE
jgi:hypothetical protein